jgi:hypothetical protein
MRKTATAPHIARRYAVMVALAVGLQSTACLALGTDEQRAACTPDVFRLCSSEIPSIDRIVACLKKEKPHLSAGCKAVFNGPEERSATRSLATPESEWCQFGPGPQDAEQKNWVKWCGNASRTQ